MCGPRSGLALALGATLALGGGGALALTLDGADPGGPPQAVVVTTHHTTVPSLPAPAAPARRGRTPKASHRPTPARQLAAAPRPRHASAPPANAAAHPSLDPRRVLIRFRPGVSAAARASARRAVGARVVGVLGPQHLEVWRIGRDRSVTRVLARYRRDGRIAVAAPNRRYFASVVPNDPLFRFQWGLDNTGQSGYVGDASTQGAGVADQDIDAPEAFDALGLGGVTGAYPRLPGFTIGIIDTGVYAQHEDLAGKVVGCVNAVNSTSVSAGCNDENGHGTHVAGIAAATADNGKGISGVAPDAGIYMCKALGKDGSGDDVGIITCINDIVAHRGQYGIHVLSMSLGGASNTPAGETDPLESAINRATTAGILVLAAAGNEYQDGNPLEYPAGYANAVSVGADDRRGDWSGFSEVNSDVEVSAPGTDIASTWPFDDQGNHDPTSYVYQDGTSMATPAAAAVAATIAERRPSDTPAQVRALLHQATDDLGPAGRDNRFGYGRVNLAKAVALTPAQSTTAPTTPTTPPTVRRTTAFAFTPTGFLSLAGRPLRGRSSLSLLARDDGRRLEVGSARRGRAQVSELRITTSTQRHTKAVPRRITIIEDGNVSRAGASRRVEVYDWRAKRYVLIAYLRRAPATDRRVRWTTTRQPTRYVSSTGLVRIRVTGTASRGLRTRTDYVRVTLDF